MQERLKGALVPAPGAPPHGLLLSSLARDAIELTLVDFAALLEEPPPPPPPLVVAWLPAGLPDDLLARLVAWRAPAPAQTYVVGCAADGGAADSERALAAGFDDFMAGRYSPRELSARLRALVRRQSAAPRAVQERLTLGRLVLDTTRHELWIDQRRVPLTALEMAALVALMNAAGRTLTREELLDGVWGEDELDVGVRAVDNLVCRLRRKLHEPGVLITVRGIGFRLADS